MAIYVRGAMRRTKLIIGGRVIALAVQFTLAQGGAALSTKQPVQQIDATEVAHWVCRNTTRTNNSDAVLLNRLSAANLERCGSLTLVSRARAVAKSEKHQR